MTVSESYLFRLAAILVKSFREELTEEERRILDEWLAVAEKNRSLYLRMQTEGWLEKKMRDALLVDTVDDYKGFMVRHRKNKAGDIRRMLLKCAAVVVVLLAVSGGLWLFRNPPRPLPGATTENVWIGKGEVLLTLGSGEKVLLQETDSVIGREERGIFLNMSGKMLSYSQKTDYLPSVTEYNTLLVPRGGEYYLVLSDGTKVWLNSESSLRYPVAFLGERREVYLKGEAFFDVVENARQPFVVMAEGAEIRVLGTEFNLRAYPGEAVVSVTLVEGSVQLNEVKKGGQIVLRLGEQGNVVKANGLVSSCSVDTYLYTAWKDGRLVFRNCRMEDLLEVLARWYDVEVFFQHEEVRNICFTGDMCKTEHIDALLKIIESNGLVAFERQGRTLIVRVK